MASREPYDAAVERGDGDAEAGADAPQCAARQKYVAAWLKGCATGSWDESKKMYDSALWDAPDHAMILSPGSPLTTMVLPMRVLLAMVLIVGVATNTTVMVTTAVRVLVLASVTARQA